MMFRPRRPFRRLPPLLRPRRRPPGPLPRRRLSPVVAEVERLMRSGRFDEAAERFLALAQEAEKRGRTGGAGELYLRAARCYLESGNEDQADDCAERSIHLLIKARRPRRVRQVLPKVLAALERRGRHEEAERLRAEAEAAFGKQQRARVQTPTEQKEPPQLPARCPACGAPIRPDEVSWLGSTTAECPYCGSVIQAG